MRANTKTHWVLYAVGVYERDNPSKPFVTAKKIANAYSDGIFQDCHAAGSPLNRLATGRDPSLFDRKRVDRNAGWEYAYRLSDAGREELRDVGAPTECPDGSSVPPEVESDTLGWAEKQEEDVLYVQTVGCTGDGNQRHAYTSNGELFKRVCGHTASPGPVTGTDNIAEMTEKEYAYLSSRCTPCMEALGIDKSDYRRELDIDVEALMNPDSEPDSSPCSTEQSKAEASVAADGGEVGSVAESAVEGSVSGSVVELSYFGPGAAALFEEKAQKAEDAGLEEIASTYQRASDLAESDELTPQMVDLLAGNELSAN